MPRAVFLGRARRTPPEGRHDETPEAERRDEKTGLLAVRLGVEKKGLSIA